MSEIGGVLPLVVGGVVAIKVVETFTKTQPKPKRRIRSRGLKKR